MCRGTRIAISGVLALSVLLAAGVAHEVNTPLGISITATSHLQEQTNILIAHLNSGKLSKQHLEKYLHNNVEASDVMLRTLKHAADLLKNFKQLAADQSMNEELTTDLKQLLDTVFGTFAYSPAGNANMINQIPANIMLHINAARLSQVFSNLVQNSLVHAFATTQAPQIKVVLEPHDEYYLLHHCCAFDCKSRFSYAQTQRTVQRGRLI